MNEQIEYMILSDLASSAIMNKTGAKLADVKFAALRLKREGVISEEHAQKYFDAQKPITRKAKENTVVARVRKAKADTAAQVEAPEKKPVKRRGRPSAKKEGEEKADTPAKATGRRRRTSAAK